MEHASIEREIHIDAPPEVVFEVVSRPEHMREWWDVTTELAPTPGATGEMAWAAGDDPRADVTPVTVVVADPPHLFTFRWTYPEDEAPVDGNSLTVSFELAPSGSGTRLRVTETGFGQLGWEAAAIAAHHRQNGVRWAELIADIGAYAERHVAVR